MSDTNHPAPTAVTTRTVRLGHSPDPDDAFMFYALAQHPPLVETGGIVYEHVLQDIQTLNERAMLGELEITAISIHAYPFVADKYVLTSCGSSMGDGYGPMIVAREPMSLDDLRGKNIAIPGRMTTAFLALQMAIGRGRPAEVAGQTRSRVNSLGQLIEDKSGTAAADDGCTFDYEVVMFDQIPTAVAEGRFDAGLLIHEGQLTFGELGLQLIVDLGAWWKGRTDLPLPLGGNVIRRDLGRPAMQQMTDTLHASIQYSLDHRQQAVEYALQFGRDLDHGLADQFVGMYVNHWTLDYGPRGRAAITRLLAEAADAGLVPPVGEIDFISAGQ